MACPFLGYDAKMRTCLARRAAGGPAAIRPDDCCETARGAYESCRDYRMAAWEGIIPLPRAKGACRADDPAEPRSETVVPPAGPTRNGS